MTFYKTLLFFIFFGGCHTATGQQIRLKESIDNPILLKRLSPDYDVNISDTTYLTSIRDSLNASGYLNHLVRRDTATAIIDIFLNNRFSHIHIKEESQQVSTISSSLSRKRTQTTTPARLKPFLNFMLDEKIKQGYPFARIEVKEWDFTKTDTAMLNVTLIYGKPRTIDKIIVEGYPNYPSKVIESFLPRKNTFTVKTIKKVDEQIKQLPYLEKIRDAETLFKNDSTYLYIYVKKKNTNRADGLLTFDNDQNGELNLNGYLDATLINNLNYGERLDFSYRNDNNQQSLLFLELTLPSLITKRLGVSGKMELQRRDSLFQNNKFQIGLNYTIQSNLETTLSYTSRKSTATDATSIVDLNTQGIISRTSYYKRSGNILQPEMAGLSLEAGVYNRKIMTDEQLQWSIELQAEKLWRLNKSFNLFVRTSSFYLDTRNVQINELRQIGGNKTIRGFNQNNIDTNAYSLLKTDVRYSLNDQIYLNIINDAGVYNEFETGNSQYMYAFGGGIAILTNAGILRLQVANGRLFNSNQSISNTIAHINLEILF